MSDNFIDTNIIIYSLGDDVDKRQRSIELININPVISAQVLNETANVLFKKLSMSVQDIQAIIMRLSKETTVTPLTEDIQHEQVIESRLQVINPFL